MSRGALTNPDRKREVREVGFPPDILPSMLGLEPGTRRFALGRCTILLSRQRAGWHLSISKPDKLPTWEEVRDARYALIPDDATMALLLPPRSEYVNVHDFCLQLYEIPGDYIASHQDRL